jgi:hypothetical protein
VRDVIADTYSVTFDDFTNTNINNLIDADSLNLEIVSGNGTTSLVVAGSVTTGTGATTIPVAGTLTLTVSADNAVTAISGSVTGRFNGAVNHIFTLTLTQGVLAKDDSDASITGTCTLAFDNNATAGTSAVLDIGTGDMSPTATPLTNITMDSVTLTAINKTFTQKGQHKILVTGTLQFDLDASSEDNNTVTVSGYMPVTVLQDYTVTAEPFKMTGSTTTISDSPANTGTMSITLWVNNITVTNS